MTRSGRGWSAGVVIVAGVALISGSLFYGSPLLVVLRTAAAVATVVMLVMIHRANRAHTRHTLEQLDHISHLLPPERNRSTVDHASRRVQ